MKKVLFAVLAVMLAGVSAGSFADGDCQPCPNGANSSYCGV